MTHTIKKILLLFVIISAPGFLLNAGETGVITVMPSIDRCFTTFLICPVSQQDQAETPSVSVCREGTKSPFGSVWSSVSGRNPKMVEIEKPGIYAVYIKLVPPEKGSYRFIFGSYADGRIIYQGIEKARFFPHTDYWINSRPFTLDLPSRGGHLLFLFGSRHGRCGFYLQSSSPDITSQLILKRDPLRKERIAADSLSCVPSRRFISGNDVLRLSIQKNAGMPRSAKNFAVDAVFKSSQGKILHRTGKKECRISGKGRTAASFSWKPEGVTVCKTEAAVTFSLDKTVLGTVTQNFYFPDMIAERTAVLLKQLKTAEKELGKPVPLAGLALEKARLLAGKTPRTDKTGARIIEMIEQTPRIISAAGNGRDPLENRKGYIERAYYSRIDNSCQPYRMYVPSQYRAGDPVPLFVYLHGYVPSYTKAEWLEEPVSITRHMEKHTCILAVPFGRSNTDFQTVGEVDVMRVIREVRQKYTIDPMRMYIIGYSMGGSGMWTIMQHYPDRFAAGISIGGRTDYYLWKNINRADLPPFKRLLIDNNNPISSPGNFMNTAFRIFHGEQDPLVKIGHSTVMQRVLEKNGINSVLTVVRGRMHWISADVFTEYNPVTWALSHKLHSYPERIHFTAYTPKYRRCFWAEILSFREYGVPAVISAHFSQNRFNVKHTNVARFRIRLPEHMSGKQKIMCMVNGKPAVLTVKHGSVIETGTSPSGSGTVSKNRVCGPLKEVFNAPFTVAYGPSFSGATCRNKARAFIREWEAFAKGSPPLISSENITQALSSRRNLVLFSDPVKGSYAERILKKTPVRITKTSYSIGSETFSSRNRGIAFIYPHPDHPERCFAFFSGLRWGTSLPVNHKFDHIPDYIIFTSGTNDDGSNRAAAAGDFDINWKFSKKLLYRALSAP